jgi:hypothetical protein
MSVYQWCQRCRAAVDAFDADLDEAGVSRCPYCGAPREEIYSWRQMRALNPDWPRHPDPGDHYVSRKIPARV